MTNFRPNDGIPTEMTKSRRKWRNSDENDEISTRRRNSGRKSRNSDEFNEFLTKLRNSDENDEIPTKMTKFRRKWRNSDWKDEISTKMTNFWPKFWPNCRKNSENLTPLGPKLRFLRPLKLPETKSKNLEFDEFSTKNDENPTKIGPKINSLWPQEPPKTESQIAQNSGQADCGRIFPRPGGPWPDLPAAGPPAEPPNDPTFEWKMR